MTRKTEEFIEHFGVKGMKWGVRNKPSKREAAIRNQRANAAARRRQLSDGDLKNFIERLSDEKKLKTLVDEDLTPAKAATKKILSASGQKVAAGVVTGAVAYGLKALFTKKFEIDKFADYSFPNPKKK